MQKQINEKEYRPNAVRDILCSNHAIHALNTDTKEYLYTNMICMAYSDGKTYVQGGKLKYAVTLPPSNAS